MLEIQWCGFSELSRYSGVVVETCGGAVVWWLKDVGDAVVWLLRGVEVQWCDDLEVGRCSGLVENVEVHWSSR